MAEENIFKSLLENLESNLHELEGGETKIKETTVFTLDGFWLSMCLAAKALSSEVTKLCMMYSKPPSPSISETLEILKTIEAVYQEMVSTFYTLPKEYGIILRKEVQKFVLKISETLIAIVSSLKDTDVKSQKDRLKLTGWMWEACEAIELLPRNNKLAVCKLLHAEELLLIDALQEIEDEVKADWAGENRVGEDIDNTVTWNNQDRELLPPCVGLVKTARSCLKRIGMVVKKNAKCDTEQHIVQLDDLSTLVLDLSPKVDDFVSSVYPPMNRNTVKSEALKVVKHIQVLLQLVKKSHYIFEEDHSWLNFLLQAVDYNNNKLQPFLVP